MNDFQVKPRGSAALRSVERSLVDSSSAFTSTTPRFSVFSARRLYTCIDKCVCQYVRLSLLLRGPITDLFHAREGFRGTAAEQRGVISADSREAKALCLNDKYLLAPSIVARRLDLVPSTVYYQEVRPTA